MPHIARAWYPLLSTTAFLVAWQLAATAADSPLLPGPIAVAAVVWDGLVSGELVRQLAITLWRVTASFVLAMAIGVAVGIAMGRSRALDRWFDSWLIILLNLPALVLIILAYVWIGLVEAALLVAVALNKIPNVVVTVREGARALDEDYLDVARSFRLGRSRTLIHVVMPQLWPFVAAAARSGLALIWKIVLVAELLGRSDGVGFQLGLFFQLFDVAGILAYAFAFIAVIQVIEHGLLQPVERHVNRWRR